MSYLKTEIISSVVKFSARLDDILAINHFIPVFMKNADVRPCFIVHSRASTLETKASKHLNYGTNIASGRREF